MNSFILRLSLFLFPSYIMAQQPKLMIGIVIDQLRYDYLERMDTLWSEEGFKRIFNEGYNYRNAHYNYAGTYTGPGHASIYTGTTPSDHGIVGNHWYQRDEKKVVYCTDDSRYKTLGDKSRAGEMSPHRLVANSMCDELRLSTNFKSKVIAISLKDRGSILPGGYSANGVYWFSDETSSFVSSTYYMDKLPKWVHDFNNRKLPEQYMKQTWTPTLPINTYTAFTTGDDVPYERPFLGESRTTFPYKLDSYRKKYGSKAIKSTPFGNTLTFEMAKAAIEGENLGKGAYTDFLAVSFSSTDYMGHQFGPNSVELWDAYVKFDLELADFLKYLDKEVGKDNYTLFITADHGVAEIPLYMYDNKMFAGYLPDDFLEELQKHSLEQFGDSLIESFINLNVYLNKEKIKSRKLDRAEVLHTFREFILSRSEVHSVFVPEELVFQSSPMSKQNRVKNGYWAKRSGDLLLVLHTGFINSKNNSQGTTHGSPYSYDTRIPILFYGAGIEKGSSVRYVEITDIAPTVSLLLKTSLPSASKGNPLLEIFDQNR